ncbi:hypothetical protein KUV80_10180 [Fictibacillus nanhaiensis]|uniref:hypothetical protein n=1 Tax=Fictibacillus nanhaiensis TaxID=742169 RepID=UPI001C95600D|nr:hypothetical protein [Fictibacillus nanhaiensis]MBY6037025.1 hypothetical protein [Fictibacillus nanhaiensis]
MDIEVGSRVVYKGEEYEVLWIYENGNVEISKKGHHRKIELVQKSDLTKLT